MIRTRIPLPGLSLTLVSLLIAGTARAAGDHTWVSGTGTGTACTRAAPCPNFATAVGLTNAGGVISVLDPGDFGGITITKSLTVRAESLDGGGTLSPAFGTWIFVQAGPTDVITVEGLHLNGLGGIVFQSGGQLHVVRCVITNGHGALPQAGIKFQPNSAGKLTVIDTVITNMGTGTGGGIVINPASGGSAQVALERVTVSGNTFGIAADGTGSTAGINMTIADSMIANNINDGIIATTPGGGALIGVMVKNTKSVNNAFGIRAIGTGVTVRVDGSSMIGNGTGLSFSGGGALQSYGNNNVDANASNGAFSGSVALK